jgi:site-specific DNA recombinase
MVTEKSRRRAIIYTRVSRDATGERAGVKRQEEDCRKLADLRGYDILRVESDNSISAYGEKERPAWTRTLASVEAGEVDVLLCWHLDRLTRSMSELEKLILLSERTDVGVLTVTGDIDLTTDVGRMVARILAAVARQEVERKGARQRRANEQRAAEGLAWPSGWRPFGFEKVAVKNSKGATLLQIPEEAELIAEAARDVLDGASLKSIARRWRLAGVSTPRSRKGAAGWTHNGVKSILLSPRNAGLAEYKGEVLGRGSWEPIYSESTHHQLVAFLTDPQRLVRTTGSRGRTPSNLLSGIARCAKCWGTVVAGTTQGQRVYKCNSDHVTTPRGLADDLVIQTIINGSLIGLPGAVLPVPETDDTEGIQTDLEALNKRQKRITSAFASGELPEDVWQSANEGINAEKAALTERLTEAGVGTSLRARHGLAIERFKTLDLMGRRDFLRSSCEITLHPRNRKRNVPGSRQVSVFLRTEHDGEARWEALIAEHPDAYAAMREGRSLWPDPLPALPNRL